MANDGTIDVKYGLDTSQASAELQRLRKDLNGMTADLLSAQRLIANNTLKMTADLRKLIGASSGKDLLNLTRKEESAFSRSTSFQAKGTRNTQVADAAVRQIIADTRSSENMLRARITDEMVRSYTRVIRNTNTAVAARINSEMARVDRLIANSTPTILSARGVLGDRANSRAIESAGNTGLYNARQDQRRQRDATFLSEFANPNLQKAREDGRIRRNADLTRQNLDVDYQNGQQIKKTLAETRTRMLAQNPGMRQAHLDEMMYQAERKLTAKARREATLLEREAAKARREAAILERKAAKDAKEAALLPGYRAAQGIIGRRNQEGAIFEAKNGRAARINQGIRERMDLNGGADMMGIQARVMGNFMALGSVFMAARSIASFIVDLDKELHSFQAISTATNAEMATMKVRLMDIATTVPFTTLELAKAATTLAQAGLSTQEVTESLGAVAQFATASGSELAQSVDIITSAITAFNLQTSQTGDIANTFTAALNLSKLTVDKLVTAMNYIAPTANAMGMTLDETVAILGALSQSGLRASTMATGTRSLLVGLQEPSKKFLAILKEMGLTQQDVNVESEGFLNVMEKLKAAGFGAAQAYEAFEIRAAASFVALSNNTQMAFEMQKAFILSNAALEASNIQMESLSNTAKNFYSVVAGNAYIAFEPVIDVLQKTLKATTALFVGLQEIPGLLQVIGVAFSALAAIAVVGIFGAAFRGLAQLVPIFGTLGTAVRGVTTGVFGLHAALALLGKHPFMLALSTVVGITSAIFSFSDATETAADRIDGLRGRVNELKGETDSLDKKMGSIEQVLESIVKHKDALDKNPLMREAKILEIQKQFKELGGSIQASTASVTDLIHELHKLKSASASLRAAASGEQLVAEENLVAEHQRSLNDYFAGGADRDTLHQSLARFIDPATRSSMMEQLRGASPEQVRQAVLSQGLRQVGSTFNNPTISGVAGILTGDRSQLNQNDPMGVAAMFHALGTEIKRLEGRRDGGEAGLEAQISLLKTFKEEFEPVNRMVQDLASSTQQVVVSASQHQRNLIESTPAFQSLSSNVTALEADIEGQKGAILRGELGTSDADKLAALDQLRTMARERLKELHGGVDEIVNQALAKDPTLNRGDVASVVNQEIDGRTASLGLELSTQQSGVAATLQKYLDKEHKKYLKGYDKALERLASRRSDALTQGELQSIDAEIKAAIDAKASGLRNYFEQKIENTKSEEDKEAIREEMDRALEETANLADSHALASVEKSNDILADSLRQQQENVDDTAKTLKKKIDEVTAKLAIARPGAAIDGLLASLDAMLAEFAKLTGQSNSLQFQREYLSTSHTPVPGNEADRASQAMQFYMGKGYSKNGAAGLVGNLLTESGLNPHAQGDRTKGGHATAFGIAQHRGSRWAELRASTKTPFDFKSQLEFIDKEIQRDYPELYSLLTDSTTLPDVAANRVMTQFERPNKDPNINHIGRRVGYANALANNDYSGQNAAVAKVEEDAAANVINSQNAAIDRSFEERLNEVDQRVNSAENALSTAQRAEYEGKYTGIDIMALEENVRLAERDALLEHILVTEEQIAQARQAQANTEVGTQEHEDALQTEIDLKERLIVLTNEKNQADAATAKQGPSVASAIQAANVAWMQQQGILDSTGNLVSAAQQTGEAWGQALSGMHSGLSTFLVNATSGTMSLGDAFKGLGLSIIDTFQQIIAKALANQIIMALFGMDAKGGSTGGGLFGDIGEMLFASVAPGAANGELIPGSIGTRDSVLRKVMPGEMILRSSAVKAIGRGNLTAMNNTANRMMADGIAPVSNDNRPQGGGQVNVWVVSPDQVPSMGPNDVVAAVADNIQRRGSIKQLIQSVQMGTI